MGDDEVSSGFDNVSFDYNRSLQQMIEYAEIRRQFLIFHRYFFSWIIPVYFVIGLVGTILCLVVLIRTKRRMHSSQITHWFIALSLSDVFVLALGLPLMYVTRLHYFVDTGPIEPRRWNKFACLSINTLLYAGLLLSTWLQTGISVLRAFSTCMPLTVRVHLSSTRSLVCLSVTTGACLLSAFLMIVLGMRYGPEKSMYATEDAPPKWRCSLRGDVASMAFFYVSLILKAVLPWILLVLASCAILSSLVRYQRSFNDCVNTSIATSDSGMGLNRTRHLSEHFSTSSSIHNRLHNAPSLSGSRRSNRLNHDLQLDSNHHRYRPDSGLRKRFQQKRISYVLLGMNLSFLLFNLPYEIFKIYYERNPPSFDRPSNLIINVFLNILVYTNNVTNWLFYMMLGARFRSQVKRLLSSLVCRSNTYRRGRFLTSNAMSRHHQVVMKTENRLPKPPQNDAEASPTNGLKSGQR